MLARTGLSGHSLARYMYQSMKLRKEKDPRDGFACYASRDIIFVLVPPRSLVFLIHALLHLPQRAHTASPLSVGHCWSLVVVVDVFQGRRSASQHHFMGEPQSPCVKKRLCVEDHVVLQARAQFARALSLPSPRNGHALSAAPKQSLLAKPARDLHEIHPPPAPVRAYRLTSAGGRAAELVDGMLRAARLVLACFCCNPNPLYMQLTHSTTCALW